MKASDILLFCLLLLLRGGHQKAPNQVAFILQEGVCCHTQNRRFRIREPNDARILSALLYLHAVAFRDFCLAAEMPLKPLSAHVFS